jgi:hypothetical protein
MIAAVQPVFSWLFRVRCFEKADDGVLEANHDIILLSVDGHALAP